MYVLANIDILYVLKLKAPWLVFYFFYLTILTLSLKNIFWSKRFENNTLQKAFYEFANTI